MTKPSYQKPRRAMLAGLALAAAAALASPLALAQQQAPAAAPAPQAQAPQGGARQAPDLPEADKQAIRNYNLNDDVFNRLIAATKEARAQNIRPQQAAPDPSKVHSLDDLAGQAVGSDPRIGPLIKKYGFTPREFMLANLALMNAAIASQAKSDPNMASQIDQSKVNQANVAFFEAHQDQIMALSRQGGG
jgi:hypothetical protein